MTTKNALYKTCFNHNDVLLDCWYDQTLEQSDENEIIDFDNVKGRYLFGQALHGHIECITTSKSGYIAFYNYDQVINDNEMLMRSMLQVYSDLNNDEFYYYYDRHCVYEALLDCIIYSEA